MTGLSRNDRVGANDGIGFEMTVLGSVLSVR